jgi:site-specific DNA-methyltransferase (adenine-specific)
VSLRLIFGSSEDMHELADKSVHLVVTSPPYFNAPFDYPNLFKSYDEFLKMIRKVAKELRRVLDEGRIACFVCDDTLINGSKYPVVSDITKIFIEEGFKYRDKIIWVKPTGYIRISRRSGVLIQHPYPMYYYPDNLQESILIFQNGEFDYSKIPEKLKEESKVDLNEWSEGKWYLTVWNITNVLPISNRLEKGIAAFPEEIPNRLIKLFSYKGETVLDPFMGSGTTPKVALELGRNAVGYDIDVELVETVKEKIGVSNQSKLFAPQFDLIIREDVKHLRTELQRRVTGEKLNNITAKITGVKYTPFLRRKLHTFDLKDFDRALSTESTFMLKINEEKQIAVSWWVSAKRTRSYPYARVYDSLSFSGRKVTIIPIVKDEGADGDRDFLQWDTVSLMSLLGVYVIIGYYKDATTNPMYPDKITSQRYDTQNILNEIEKLMSYQSDALHWNLSQLEKAGEIGEKAIESYTQISKKLGVKMHSVELARERIKKLLEGKEAFMSLSRDLAEKAQKRESVTKQPSEKLEGEKAKITIKNYLGGEYFFTCDEAEIHDNDIYLIEGKHTEGKRCPSLNDIKDGLLKMILLTNLQDVKIEKQRFNPVPILKLTTEKGSRVESLNNEEKELISILKKEAEKNNFKILWNADFLS